MKSFLVFLKASLKSLLKSSPINLLFFIGLPVFLTLVMGFVNDSSENPVEVKSKPIIIEDNDNTQSSKNLVGFLSNEGFNNVITITQDKSEAYLSVVIPTGFESSLLNNQPTNIKIDELKDRFILVKTVDQILLSYFDNYYSGDLSNLLKTPSISTEYIEPIIAENSFAFYSASMIGYMITMLVMTLGNSAYMAEDMGLNKRVYSAPKSNLQLFLENFIVSMIQGIVLILGYVLFFRLTNISYTGSLPLLLLICLVCSFTVTSISTVVNVFFSKKFGSAIITGLFFLHIAIGNVFVDFGGNLANFSLFTSSQTMFKEYVYNGSFANVQSSLLITLAIGFVLFIAAIIKDTKFRRES